MMKKLHLIQKMDRLYCTWVMTGDPKRPLACIWVGSRTQNVAPTASSADEIGRMHLCA